MKKIVLLACFATMYVSAFSQIENYKKKSPESQKKKPLLPANLNQPKIAINGVPRKQYNMPVLALESKGVYKGNNGMGSDIYTYSPDNMPVLKPDSTYQTSMPVIRRAPKKKN